MLGRFLTNKARLGGVLVVYGAFVLLLDVLGAGELVSLAVPLIIIPLAVLVARPRRWFSGMLMPGMLICGAGATAYGSLNWIDYPPAGLVYAAFLLLAVSWGYALYQAFSTPA
jgi:hypothetical protein